VSKLLIASGVRWRHWDDGIAVFIPATCETHVLSLALLPIFEGDHCASKEGTVTSTFSSSYQDDSNSELKAVIEQLGRLKIIEVTE
jgi:hypothetical protein